MKSYYDSDEIITALLDSLEYNTLTGQIPTTATEADMQVVADRICAVIEANAETCLSLKPLDHFPGAAAFDFAFPVVIGGESVMVSVQICNTHPDPDGIWLNINPGFKEETK